MPPITPEDPSHANDGVAPLVAGIELGGTKSIIVLGRGRELIHRLSFATDGPAVTLGALGATLAEWKTRYAPLALGIASFGPVSIDPAKPSYGHILSTTKPNWAGVDIVSPLANAAGVSVALHTDVSAAALAEGHYGNATGCRDYVYVTIGTGIGMGIVSNGKLITGLLHPEAGHVRVRRMVGDTFAGICPFHGDCLEGLASGPAIAARGGASAEHLDLKDPVWDYVVDALAEAFTQLFHTLAPAKILIGGGVGVGQTHLTARIRRAIVEKTSGYLPFLNETTIEHRVTVAGLGTDAGPVGALLLAQLRALSDQRGRWGGAVIASEDEPQIPCPAAQPVPPV